MKSEAFLLSGWRTSHFRFYGNPATEARMFGGFASSRERAPSGQKLHPPHILSEPLSLLLTFVTIVKIEEGRYMPKGSGKVIAQNKKHFMIISSKKHTKQGLSFKERKLSRFALDA